MCLARLFVLVHVPGNWVNEAASGCLQIPAMPASIVKPAYRTLRWYGIRARRRLRGIPDIVSLVIRLVWSVSLGFL